MKFTEILDLAGYSDYEIKKSGKHWELWQAKLKHVVEEKTSNFIFFNSRATLGSIDEVKRASLPQKFHIVIQNSAPIASNINIKKIKEDFKDNSVRTIRELLSEIILKSIERKNADFEEIEFFTDFKARDRAKILISEYEKIAYAPMDKYPPSELRLGNVPVVVDMLSQCAEDPSNTSVNPQKDPIYEIIRMLCRREKHRQQLQTGEDTQINIFKDIAINFEDSFSSEDLELIAQMHSDEFQVSSKMNALHIHPLVDKQNDNFTFRYEFMPTYLRAMHTVDNICLPEKYNELLRIFSKYPTGTSSFYDYLEDIMDRKYVDYSDIKSKLSSCISKLYNQKHWQETISSVVLQLILRLINRKKRELDKKAGHKKY